MDVIKNYLRLLRVHQWYKNLVVFVGLFFGGVLFSVDGVAKSVFAFFSLAFASSFNYIINDIRDREDDRKHKEKQYRPIASGKISVREAVIVALSLLILSTVTGLMVSVSFLFFPVLLVINTSLYSFFLKKIEILDIHSLAFNFIIRAVAGAYAVGVEVSPWLVVMIFFIALFLASGKRMGDARIKNDRLKEHVFDKMRTILASIVLVSYALYSFQNKHTNMFLMSSLIPATFLVLRYLYLTEVDDRIARNTELIFLDKAWLIGLLIWIILCFAGIYGV